MSDQSPFVSGPGKRQRLADAVFLGMIVISVLGFLYEWLH